MKTAISVPDETYERVERVARDHGLNRSQFYAAAAERYADELEKDALTEEINALADILNKDESSRVAVEAGRQYMAGLDDEW